MDDLQIDNSQTKMDVTQQDQKEQNDPSSDSEDENISFTKPKKKLMHLCESDSEEATQPHQTSDDKNSDPESDLEISTNKKSRRIINNNSDSDESNAQSTPVKQQLSPSNNENASELHKHDDDSNQSRDDEKCMKSKLSDLCDPDSSDSECETKEETSHKDNSIESPIPNLTQDSKHRPTQRMSAKQAMDQMHKIKSESSRMMREKEVYLPYHKPKQISLKDFISKKNIKFIPGVKKPTFRMNQEQLKEYANQLEKREKEMLELYESESDEEMETIDEIISTKPTDILENKVDELPISEVQSTEAIDEECEKIKTIRNDCEENTTDNTASRIYSSEELSSLVNKEESHIKIDEMETCITNVENNILKDNEIDDGVIHPTSDSSNTLNSSTITPTSNVDNEESPMTFKRQLLDHLSCSLPNPKLSGCGDGFIDFTSDIIKEELSGVNAFKRKFLFHASIKTTEDLAREKEKTDVPGTALMNFKRELIDHISEQRLQEWKRKNEEELIRKREEKINDELSDLEEQLEGENSKYDKPTEVFTDNEIEEEPDTEDEEDDDILIKESKKPKKKCDFIDGEAELDDDDDNRESDEDEESDDESDAQIEATEQSEKKKKLTRIIKPSAESDSSDEDITKNIKNDAKHSASTLTSVEDEALNVLKTPVDAKALGSVDIFNSPEVNKSDSLTFDSDDCLTLGQKSQTNTNSLSSSEPKHSGLANLISPLTKYSTMMVTSSESINSDLNKTPLTQRETAPIKNAGWIDLQKRLFSENDTSENIQDTQEIADLCSGKFPTQPMDTTITDSDTICEKNSSTSDSQMMQSTESELLELCTGKFEGINDSTSEKLIESQTIQIYDSNMFEHNSDTALAVQPNLSLEKCNEILPVLNPNETLKHAPKTKPKGNNIKSFFMPVNKVNVDTIVNTEHPKIVDVENVIEPNDELPKVNYTILSSTSSSDEKENVEMDSNKKVKKLKSKHDRNKKRKAKPLMMSDDESDNELSHEDDPSLSNKEDQDNEKEVEYDSEENEIDVIPEKIVVEPKKKQTSQFFEQEAELTTDDEWRGSGDEDERGLNEFEWEEGDADQLDQRKVNKELERIHRYQMLDQDKREIKLIQDILLEDGDLEGGTRERKFRWKNVDTAIESGAIVGDDNQDDGFEDQSEELWRRQRYERETFLREMTQKHEASQNSVETDTPTQMVSRLSFIKASLKSSLKPVDENNKSSCVDQAKLCNTPNETQNECNESEKCSKKSAKDLPSPVKKPFMLIQHNFKGSFLSRSQAALDRLALLAKGNIPANGNDPPKNLSSLAPGKRKNFVFHTISPPCNNEKSEDVKLVKRKLASETSTPSISNLEGDSKKLRLSKDFVPKSKKSLLDYME